MAASAEGNRKSAAGAQAPVTSARAEAAVRAAEVSGGSQWQIWTATTHLLLDTSEKAATFAEAVVRAAYGPDQAEEERPFSAEDIGDEWRVQGTRPGSHAMPFFLVSSTVILAKKTGAIVDYRLSMPGLDTSKPLGNE